MNYQQILDAFHTLRKVAAHDSFLRVLEELDHNQAKIVDGYRLSSNIIAALLTRQFSDAFPVDIEEEVSRLLEHAEALEASDARQTLITDLTLFSTALSEDTIIKTYPQDFLAVASSLRNPLADMIVRLTKYVDREFMDDFDKSRYTFEQNIRPWRHYISRCKSVFHEMRIGGRLDISDDSAQQLASDLVFAFHCFETHLYGIRKLLQRGASVLRNTDELLAEANEFCRNVSPRLITFLNSQPSIHEITPLFQHLAAVECCISLNRDLGDLHKVKHCEEVFEKLFWLSRAAEGIHLFHTLQPDAPHWNLQTEITRQCEVLKRIKNICPAEYFPDQGFVQALEKRSLQMIQDTFSACIRLFHDDARLWCLAKVGQFNAVPLIEHVLTADINSQLPFVFLNEVIETFLARANRHLEILDFLYKGPIASLALVDTQDQQIYHLLASASSQLNYLGQDLIKILDENFDGLINFVNSPLTVPAERSFAGTLTHIFHRYIATHVVIENKDHLAPQQDDQDLRDKVDHWFSQWIHVFRDHHSPTHFLLNCLANKPKEREYRALIYQYKQLVLDDLLDQTECSLTGSPLHQFVAEIEAFEIFGAGEKETLMIGHQLLDCELCLDLLAEGKINKFDESILALSDFIRKIANGIEQSWTELTKLMEADDLYHQEIDPVRVKIDELQKTFFQQKPNLFNCDQRLSEYLESRYFPLLASEIEKLAHKVKELESLKVEGSRKENLEGVSSPKKKSKVVEPLSPAKPDAVTADEPAPEQYRSHFHGH